MDSTSVGGKGISIACQIFVKRKLLRMDNNKKKKKYHFVWSRAFASRIAPSVHTILIACKRCRWAPSCTSLLHMDMAKIKSIKRRKQNWLHDRQWNIYKCIFRVCFDFDSGLFVIRKMREPPLLWPLCRHNVLRSMSSTQHPFSMVSIFHFRNEIPRHSPFAHYRSDGNLLILWKW